jgi:hypothetical protein
MDNAQKHNICTTVPLSQTLDLMPLYKIYSVRLPIRTAATAVKRDE